MDTTNRHPSVQQIADHFGYAHLSEDLGNVSKIFHDAAEKLLATVKTDNAELTVALRKLLEGKDAAVRAALEAQHDLPSADLPAEAPVSAPPAQEERLTLLTAPPAAAPAHTWPEAPATAPEAPAAAPATSPEEAQ